MPEAQQLARASYLVGLLQKKDPNEPPWAMLGDELASRTYKAQHLRPAWWRNWRGRRNLNNLLDVAMFAQMPVRSALRSSFVMFAAQAFFSGAGDRQRKIFRMNPANTTVFQGLKALEDRAIIDLAQLLKNPPTDAEIRGREKLFIHRDMVCHPAIPLWRYQNRQAFADAGHQFSHVRVGLIWDIRKSINEALTAKGKTDLLDGVPVDWEMAAMLRFILELSLAPGVGVASTDDLLNYLHSQIERFARVLDDFPDGIHPDESTEARPQAEDPGSLDQGV